jgi:hypothetical protein
MSASDRAARATYHGKTGYGVSPGLARARLPFRTKNAFTGLAVGGFIAFVYFYSIRAVKQDDFSDIEMPSEAERKNTRSIEDLEADRIRLRKEMIDGFKEPQGLESKVLDQTRGAFVGNGATQKSTK